MHSLFVAFYVVRWLYTAPFGDVLPTQLFLLTFEYIIFAALDA